MLLFDPLSDVVDELKGREGLASSVTRTTCSLTRSLATSRDLTRPLEAWVVVMLDMTDSFGG